MIQHKQGGGKSVLSVQERLCLFRWFPNRRFYCNILQVNGNLYGHHQYLHTYSQSDGWFQWKQETLNVNINNSNNVFTHKLQIVRVLFVLKKAILAKRDELINAIA